MGWTPLRSLSFSIKENDDGMATYPFSPKGMGTATYSNSLKGMGMTTYSNSLKGDGDAITS